jgi:hypothetical protein
LTALPRVAIFVLRAMLEAAMTMYDGLMALCVVFAVGVIAKGFWGSTRVKPIDQPDNFKDLGPTGD